MKEILIMGWRGIQLFLSLLLIALLRHSSERLVKVLDRLWPVKEEIAFIIGSFIGNWNGLLLGFIQPVALGLLYLSVYFPLMKVMYPTHIQNQLRDHNLLISFRTLVAVNVVITYLISKGILTWMGSDSSLFTIHIYGLSVVLWLFFATSLYFAFLLPLSLGYVLSLSEGGISTHPDPNGAAVALKESLLPGGLSQSEIEDSSPFVFWADQGVYHAAPVFILGILFIVTDAIFPVVEMLLGLGIIFIFLQQKSSKEAIETFDLEQRLAGLLRFTTVNYRGAISSVTIIVGCVIVAVLVVRLSPLLVSRRMLEMSRLELWSWLGLVSAILMYAVLMVKHWLVLAERFPWFISDWTSKSELFDSRSFYRPSNPYPDRFPVGPTLPTLLLVMSVLAFVYPLSLLGQLYPILWPPSVIAIWWLFNNRNRSKRSPSRDNMAIFYTIQLQQIILIYLLALPIRLFVESDNWAIQSYKIHFASDLSFMLIIIFGAVLLFSIVYFLPDIMELAVTRDMKETLSSSEPLSVRGKKQALNTYVTICSVMTACAVVIVQLMSGEFWLPLWYLLAGLCTFSAMVWHLDSELFEESVEFPLRIKTYILAGIYLYLLGWIYLLREDGFMPDLMAEFLFIICAIGILFTIYRLIMEMID